MAWAKRHNTATESKALIRRNVLEHLGADACRVLDCYCGPTGEMWSRVWQNAASYTGIDKEWRGLADPRRRLVGDTTLLLRAIDLGPFNVFDVDCYGCPWPAMLMIQHHKVWEPGERGAVIITDGAFIKSALGGMPHALAQALGRTSRTSIAGRKSYDEIRRLALQRWLDAQRLEPIAGWQAQIRKGSQMYYGALVFEAQA